jgi:predicted acylesterase/phospholipase RssA/peptidoglycan hydrolase-like protein with peptidoglycan-binding domain
MPVALPASARLGDRGDQVRDLQDALVAVALGLPEGMAGAPDLRDLAGALEAERTDKLFGEATREAVQRFQKADGLDTAATGEFDESTSARLLAVAQSLPGTDPRAYIARSPERARMYGESVATLGADRLAIDRFVKGAGGPAGVADALRLIGVDPWARQGAELVNSLLGKIGPEALKGGVVDETWFSHGGAPSARMREDASRVLQTFLAAAAAGAKIPDRFGAAVVQLMFVQHPAAQLVRDVLFGRMLPEDGAGRPIGPQGPGLAGLDDWDSRIPRWTDFDRFRDVGCVADLSGALDRVGGALSGLSKPQPKTGVTISALDPKSVCSGSSPPQRLTITGQGFGSQRLGDAVYFDDRRAEVVIEWTDRRIVVEVPPGLLGGVCVGVLENTNADLTGLADAVGAANEAGQVLEDCFGIRQNLGPGLFGVYSPRADCTPTNALWVGPPAIDSFLANGSNQLAKIGLNGTVTLTWATRFADTVALSVAAVVGPLDAALQPPASAVGATGRQSFGPVPRRDPWEVEYTLSATNACGTQTRTVRAAFGLQLGVAFVGTGTRTVFHAGAMEYLALHLTVPPRAVASGGMGAMAALTMAQDYRNPAPLIAAWNALAVPNWAPDRPFDGMAALSFLLEEDASIRQIFQDFEDGMYAQMLEAVYAMTNEVLMSYADAPSIELPDIKIGDSDQIVAEKINKAMEDAFWTVAKMLAANALGEALDAGGKPATKIAKFGEKLAGESMEIALEKTVSGVAKTSIAAVGKALFAVNPLAGVAFVLVAFLVKAGIEAGMAVDKAKKMTKALATRGLAKTTRLQGLFDDLVQRLNLQNRTIGNPIHVALGAAALEPGEPVYFGGFGNLMSSRGTTLSSRSPGWGAILSATSAIPGAMAPTKLANLNIVDTTIADYAPLEPLHRLGVDEIICVHATLTTLASPEPPVNFDEAGFLTVVRRAERVRSAAGARTAIDPFVYWRTDDSPATAVGRLPARVRHVVPTMVLPLLNAFDYEPGLADIWQDYGYMRAFDVLAPLQIFPTESPDSDRKRRELRNLLANTSDLITATREMCWDLEHALNQARAVSAGFTNQRVGRLVVTLQSLGDMERLRTMKRTIAQLLTRRLQLVRDSYRLNPGAMFPGAAVPAGRYTRWFQGYERHPWSFGNLNHTDPAGGTDENPWMTISGFNDPQFASMINAAAAPVVNAALLTPGP